MRVKGGERMAQYETKVILKMVTEIIVHSNSLQEAYESVAECAKDEGLQLPTYEERIKKKRSYSAKQEKEPE